MPTVGVDSWWTEFQAQPGAFDDAHESARRLRRHARRLEPEVRTRFLDRLCRVLFQERYAYGVGLFLLEGISDPADLRPFARHLLPLPAVRSDDEEARLADLVRILAAGGDPSLTGVLESYFLEREIGPHWASAPWALWPRRKTLFARAWCRFFAARDPADGSSMPVVRSFLAEPAAIGVVHRRLAEESPERWEPLRDALARQAEDVGWLTPRQRKALERVLT